MVRAGDLFVPGGRERAKSIAGKDENKSERWSVLLDCVEKNKLIALGKLLQAGDVVGAVNWWAARVNRSSGLLPYLIRLVDKRGLPALTTTPKLYVGTIHSFKGAEADVVFVFPDLSPQAGQSWVLGMQGRTATAKDPIVRAFYVAMTRAREHLYLCQPSGTGLAVPLAVGATRSSVYQV